MGRSRCYPPMGPFRPKHRSACGLSDCFISAIRVFPACSFSPISRRKLRDACLACPVDRELRERAINGGLKSKFYTVTIGIPANYSHNGETFYPRSRQFVFLFITCHVVARFSRQHFIASSRSFTVNRVTLHFLPWWGIRMIIISES